MTTKAKINIIISLLTIIVLVGVYFLVDSILFKIEAKRIHNEQIELAFEAEYDRITLVTIYAASAVQFNYIKTGGFGNHDSIIYSFRKDNIGLHGELIHADTIAIYGYSDLQNTKEESNYVIRKVTKDNIGMPKRILVSLIEEDK